MGIDYIEYAKIFKVFSDPKRLKIINMLSNGELCACKILEEFQIKRRKVDTLFFKQREDERDIQNSRETDDPRWVFKHRGL